jgi:hypothetical protein
VHLPLQCIPFVIVIFYATLIDIMKLQHFAASQIIRNDTQKLFSLKISKSVVTQ